MRTRLNAKLLSTVRNYEAVELKNWDTSREKTLLRENFSKLNMEEFRKSFARRRDSVQ